MKRLRVVVRGRVQGVFFRDSVRREAERVGVAGWVLNRDDGAVEAAFEGEAGAVEAIVEFCRSDPGHSSVEAVDVTDEEPEGAAGFEIR